MDGAFIDRIREGQADGLAAGCEPLARMRDTAAAKTTRMGNPLGQWRRGHPDSEFK